MVHIESVPTLVHLWSGQSGLELDLLTPQGSLCFIGQSYLDQKNQFHCQYFSVSVVIRMSCCSSRKSSTDAVLDGTRGSFHQPFLRGGEDEGSTWQEDERKGPTGDNFPTWVKDEDASECYDCGNRFNSIIDRKHHCRKCRNIFCKLCSNEKSKILLFSINEEVRVCRECLEELPVENNYIIQYRPVLQNGENFKKSIMMGLSTKVVRLRLMQNETTLVYDDESRAEPTEIQLAEIKKLSMTSLKAFEIITDKSFCFEADSSNTLKLWIAALNEVIRRAKEPKFREKVDNARRLRLEASRKEESARRRGRNVEARVKEASNIKYNYSNKS